MTVTQPVLVSLALYAWFCIIIFANIISIIIFMIISIDNVILY